MALLPVDVMALPSLNPLSWLSDLIRDSVVALAKAIGSAARAVYRSLGIVVSAMVACVVFLVDLVKWVAEQVVALFLLVADFIGLIADGGLMTNQGFLDTGVGKVVNTFVPLQEMIAMLVLLTAAWVIATSVRVTKSFIPTVS